MKRFNGHLFCRKLIALIVGAIVVFSISACDSTIPESSAGDQCIQIPYEQTSDQSISDFSDVYCEVSASVVVVAVRLSESSTIFGSGFVIDDVHGYILTSASLIAGNGVLQPKYSVVFNDSGAAEATLYGYGTQMLSRWFYQADSVDQNRLPSNADIAVLKIETINGQYTDMNTGELRLMPEALTFGDADSLSYGEDCFIIGSVTNQAETIRNAIASGIIAKPYNTHASAFEFSGGISEDNNFFDGSFEYLIQTSIQTNPGNEGAPLFNAAGEVIGLLNRRVEETARYVQGEAYGISFATPSTTIRDTLSDAQINIAFEETTEPIEHFKLIENADTIQIATDPVAQILMRRRPAVTDTLSQYIGSSDYFVASQSSTIVFNAKNTQQTQEGMTVAQRVAVDNLDKVVKIVVYYDHIGNEPVIGLNEGSGFLVDTNGSVLTNLHVINKLSSQNQIESGIANTKVDIEDISVYAVFERGTDRYDRFILLPMEVVAYQQKGDLAVLRFQNEILSKTQSGTYVNGFTAACVLEADVPLRGQSVYAIGNGIAYGIAISDGIVSIPAVSRYFDEYGYNLIQTDCPINGGNSGGPLIDANGHVVGINTLGLGGELVVDYGYENVSWSIPSAYAIDFLNAVSQNENQDGVKILQ